ncbi:7TM diverse intracellular signaling domain-containing protein [Pseudohongiella acticola]|uniref:7TM diverse intracellular signaling domain-containing protein n=1 Tax=Pseudohongiella acticola TaxID=1524254 RepID=UPI0009F48711|nr:7TM diverse intracellular signaling domain-containing protein [Pseudohongiella acticola]
MSCGRLVQKIGAALAVLLLSTLCLAQERDALLQLTPSTDHYQLTPYLHVLEDVQGRWGLQQAIAEFEATPTPALMRGIDNFGLSDSVYWIKADVQLQGESDGWLLEMSYPALDRIDLFYRDGSGELIQKTGGDTLPFSSRDLQYPTVVFSLDLSSDRVSSLYFRVASQGSVQFPMSIWQGDAFRNSQVRNLLGLGLYYGIMFAMVFYNLFILLSIRDRSYLYYILYVLGIIGYQMANDGLAHQFLWPEFPQFGTYSLTSSACLALVFGLLFCTSFLQVKQHSPLLHKGLLGLAVLTALAGVAPVLLDSYTLAAIATPALGIFVALVIMLTGSWIMLKGFRAARFFMLAWVVFLIATIEVSMQRYGLLGSNFLTENGMYIGTAMEMLLLSLALADRINTLTRDRELAVTRLLENNALTIQTLERADSMKNEFIANVSHELRTPLTGMVGLLDIVIPKVEGRIETKDMENLAMIRSSGWRLTSLVNDIVDISAINRDYLRLERKPVDINTIVNLVLAMCQPLVGNKDLTLKSEVPADLPLAFADEDRIQQIIFNLVSNAVKFTFSGSITVSAEVQGSTLLVSVRDTGMGIAKERQEAIFEAFEHEDSTIQREFGGSGLGLSIANKLLHLHGSHFDVDSAPGAGACFRFGLPLAGEADLATEQSSDTSRLLTLTPRPVLLPLAAPESHTSESPAVSTGKSILIVDDEAINLHVLQEYLKDHYRLLLAQDGFEALAILEQEQPELVLLDLMMPRMSGYELCRKIREIHSPGDLPVLILTAKNQVEDMVASLRAGANDYLSKPFLKDELLARIDKQLQLHDLILMRDENIRLQEQIRRYRDAELRLHASRQRLASMLDVGSDALLAVDEGGDIVFMNRLAATLLGGNNAELTGRPVEILAGNQDQHPFNFPFQQTYISEDTEAPRYFSCELLCCAEETGASESVKTLQACILPLDLEQEFYVIVLEQLTARPELAPVPVASGEPPQMPRLIEEVTRNTQRVQLLSELLLHISTDTLQQQSQLLDKLAALDVWMEDLARVVNLNVDQGELEFRQALVTLMQQCVDVWQRTTQRSVLDLAEQSRIWRVSIDNGRLRARSMERYLNLSKLPRNPRWREVSRTAYYLLGNLALRQDDKESLETSLQRMQDLLRNQR